MIVHILNGDALSSQLPDNINPRITMKECLIEGPVQFQDEISFWIGRSAYLMTRYHSPQGEYEKLVRDKISEIKLLPDSSELCLWFEFDLFCQVNMWFVVDYINLHTHVKKISWAMPDHLEWSGFGSMNPHSLSEAYNNRMQLKPSEIIDLSKLWTYFKKQNITLIEKSPIIQNLRFSKITPAVQALIGLFPKSKNLMPQIAIEEIRKQFPGADFVKIFQLFSERHGVYGYGDIQVKKIMEQMNHTSHSS